MEKPKGVVCSFENYEVGDTGVWVRVPPSPLKKVKTPWPRGKAEDCKPFYAGSIPVGVSV